MKRFSFFSLIYLLTFLPVSLPAQNIFYVTNTNNNGEGSLREALLAANNGGTIIIDEALKGDTIFLTSSLQNNTNRTADAQVHIIGNGAVISKTVGITSDPTISITGQNFTVENLIFDKIWVQFVQNIALEIKNCQFKQSTSGCLSLTARSSGNYNSDFNIIGCEFIGDQENISHLTLSSTNRNEAIRCYLNVTSCSFINPNGKSSIEYSSYREASIPETTLTNNVFVSNTPAVPSVKAPIVFSKGYNVSQGDFEVEVEYIANETDIINAEMKNPLLSDEDGIYKVWNDGAAYQNLPANTVIEGVEFPEKDISGNFIDYTKPTNSGACQESIHYIFVEGIAFEEKEEFITLYLGRESRKLNVLIEPFDATNQTIIWEGENEAYATVDEEGYITAVGEGVTTIKVTTQEGGYEARIDVVVMAVTEVESITLNETESELRVNETLELIAIILPQEATFPTVVWSSSDASVATVEDGLVTAIAPGTAIITATAEDNEERIASCEITIPQDVTGIELNAVEKILQPGEKFILEATVLPTDATYREVIWSTGNETIATVEDGVVTAISEGEVNITATTVEGEFTAICLITVEDETVGIHTIDPEKVIYPNPFNDYIIVNVEEETIVTIYDLTGQPVLVYPVTTTDNYINTTILSSGSYLLKAGTTTVKIMK